MSAARNCLMTAVLLAVLSGVSASWAGDRKVPVEVPVVTLKSTPSRAVLSLPEREVTDRGIRGGRLVRILRKLQFCGRCAIGHVAPEESEPDASFVGTENDDRPPLIGGAVITRKASGGIGIHLRHTDPPSQARPEASRIEVGTPKEK